MPRFYPVNHFDLAENIQSQKPGFIWLVCVKKKNKNNIYLIFQNNLLFIG